MRTMLVDFHIISTRTAQMRTIQIFAFWAKLTIFDQLAFHEFCTDLQIANTELKLYMRSTDYIVQMNYHVRGHVLRSSSVIFA
jgi:hypothetical protein